MLESPFSLGDIVALKSHPFQKSLTSAVISGEPMQISPLLVVVEIVIETKDQFDEKHGQELSRKGNCQCKCLWFSSKTFQFEETWISSKNIKLIEKTDGIMTREHLMDISSTSFSSSNFLNVQFRTLELEMGKQKSSLSIDGYSNSAGESKTVTNALLTFVSPIMEVLSVMDTKEVDQKEPKYDSRTGRQKRYSSTFSVKCKWYNPIGEKISEKILPIEALKAVPLVDVEMLVFIESAIKSGKYFETDFAKNKAISKTIIRPKRLLYRGGRYYLGAFDYVLNVDAEFEVGVYDIDLKDHYYTSQAPTFDFLSKGRPGRSLNKEISECISKASKKKKLIRIKYVDNLGRSTHRTLMKYSFLPFKLEKDDTFYIEGYCLKADAVRTFRGDRVKKIEVLDLTFV